MSVLHDRIAPATAVRRLLPPYPARARALLLLLFSVLGVAGCSEIFSEGYEYGTVEVQAVRRNGEPVPGVRVTLTRGPNPLAYGVTDSLGRYRFEFVPKGRLAVFAEPPEEYRPLDLQAGYWAYGISMVEGGADSARFTYLKFGDGALLVEVVDETGAAVEGAPVEIFSSEGFKRAGVTSPTGTYRFEPVPFGDYGVNTVAPYGYIARDGRGSVVVDRILIEGGLTERVRVPLDRCRGQISVVARDEGGRPVAGALLGLYTPRGEVARTTTDDAGAVTFRDLPCDDYAVYVLSAQGYTVPPGRGGSYVDALVVTQGSGRAVTFTLEQCRGRIAGRVVDGGGAGVEGARLVLYSTTGIVQEAITGADGSFALERVPCGPAFGLAVRPPAGYSVAEGRGSSYYDAIGVTSGSTQQFGFVLRAQ